jgi:hypothetical protein
MPGIIVQDDFGQYRTLDDELRQADGACGARSYILDLMTAAVRIALAPAPAFPRLRRHVRIHLEPSLQPYSRLIEVGRIRGYNTRHTRNPRAA